MIDLVGFWFRFKSLWIQYWGTSWTNSLRLKKKISIAHKIEKMLAWCVENILLSLARKQCVSFHFWKKKTTIFWEALATYVNRNFKTVLISQRGLYFHWCLQLLCMITPELYTCFIFPFLLFPYLSPASSIFMDKCKTLSHRISYFKKFHVIAYNTLQLARKL